jgi:hypothetical protein
VQAFREDINWEDSSSSVTLGTRSARSNKSQLLHIWPRQCRRGQNSSNSDFWIYLRLLHLSRT